jgi:hypothetical protein
MSVQRARSEITSSEFIEWIVYLNEDELRMKPIYYYLANVALETRRSYMEKPSQVSLDSFILKFNDPDKKEVKEEKMKKSKRFWLSGLGIKTKGKV